MVDISVVIPVYNGEVTIARCLDSLLAQAHRQFQVEVIVVDDCSTDRTREILTAYSGVRSIFLSVNQGPAGARNRGAAESQGSIVLFTDADCIPESDWLHEMVEPFHKDSRVIGVKGVYRTRQPQITARFVQLEYEDKYDKMAQDQEIDFIDTYAAAYRTAVFLEMGGFDGRFPVACAEDVDLSFRMADQGHKMVFAPRAIVYHIHPFRWMDYVRKKYKFAFWRVAAVRRTPKRAMRDSHTPWSQKAQMILIPLSTTMLLIGVGSPLGPWPGVVGWCVAGLSMLPFIAKSIRRDPLPALLAPVYLIPRAFVQFVAVIFGLTFAMQNPSQSDQTLSGSSRVREISRE